MPDQCHERRPSAVAYPCSLINAPQWYSVLAFHGFTGLEKAVVMSRAWVTDNNLPN